MDNEAADEKRYQEVASTHLVEMFGESANETVTGLLIGIRLQEADSGVAQRFWQMMLADQETRTRVQAIADQLAAVMRDW